MPRRLQPRDKGATLLLCNFTFCTLATCSLRVIWFRSHYVNRLPSALPRQAEREDANLLLKALTWHWQIFSTHSHSHSRVLRACASTVKEARYVFHAHTNHNMIIVSSVGRLVQCWSTCCCFAISRPDWAYEVAFSDPHVMKVRPIQIGTFAL